jgi:peptidoglycan/LPS O-acetylase OafA/YrhL
LHRLAGALVTPMNMEIPVETRSFAKNTEIEVLRAYAILFTLVFHLKLLLPGGGTIGEMLAWLDLSVGVDLFLVISGYVITASISQSRSKYPVSAGALIMAFWIKRVYRLWPSAWTWIVVAILAQLSVSSVVDLSDRSGDIVWQAVIALINMMNLFTPHCVASGGGVQCVVDNYLGHYWSLSLEEQFYILFPLLFFLVPRRVFIIALVAGIVFQFTWSRPFFTYSWYFKTDALLWGILLALLQQLTLEGKVKFNLNPGSTMLRCLGLLLITLLPLVASRVQGIGSAMQPYGVGLVALICACAVGLAALERGTFQLNGYGGRIMQYFASRSYSMYLVHLIVILSVRDLFQGLGEEVAMGGTATGLALIVAVFFTVLFTELNYRFIESGIRDRGRVIASKRLSRALSEESRPS